MATQIAWFRKKKPHKHSWMTDSPKKKFYGGKGKEYNGYKKVKRILFSSTELWLNVETITGSSNYIITREKLCTPSRKFRRSSFITSRSFSRKQLLADTSPLNKLLKIFPYWSARSRMILYFALSLRRKLTRPCNKHQ